MWEETIQDQQHDEWILYQTPHYESSWVCGEETIHNRLTSLRKP